jgi:hypothetical protein
MRSGKEKREGWGEERTSSYLDIKEGRLKDGSREDYLIERGVIISIDSLWSHEPSLSICGSIHPSDVQKIMELCGRGDIFKMLILLHLESSVVHPHRLTTVRQR